MRRAAVALAATAVLGVVGGVIVAARGPAEAASCAAGFTRVGARCCPSAGAPPACARAASSCPAPLVPTPRGCDVPERDLVQIPETTAVIGPSDWEAEGRVEPRSVRVGAFAIDRFEVTVGRACASAVFAGRALCEHDDAARAAYGVTLAEARSYCRARGGRLPTEDEWIAAAAGAGPRRYPWGDTGAVCRRAAWGLETGPCATGGAGPDTAGAHPDGATPLGVHDLAGNVAEWVEAPCEGGGACLGAVRGGSWRSALATELRTWLSRRVPPDRADATIGFRCAYDGVGWSVP